MPDVNGIMVKFKHVDVGAAVVVPPVGCAIENATYVSSFSVATQDTQPWGVAFSPDGTKMFVVGIANASIYRYDLSVAWDITSATYTSVFSVHYEQAFDPADITFSPDGTKMFIIGSSNDKVSRYNLSTAWDITTATYVSELLVRAQDTYPLGVAFSPDGTKMFMVGRYNDSVYRYDLSIVWDITTATYVSLKDVSAQETVPRGLTFSGDGTIMFVVGTGNDSVFQYNLTTAWDITTAIYECSKDVSAQDTSPRDVDFTPDGTSMFVVGTENDLVYRYDLT